MGGGRGGPPRGRGPRRCPGPRRGGPARLGGAGVLKLLIREAPAIELTVATRILAHLGLLGPDGRAALLVGSEVVYVGGREASPVTMTPYDVAAVRLRDGLELAGRPPADLARYLDALRADPSARAAALTAGGEVATAADAMALVETASGMPWAEAEGRTRAAGGLLGAYTSEQ